MIPTYLRNHVHGDGDIHQAALRWFRDAKYGLFLHYGLYSIPGRHEWVQFKERIPVAEYAKLADQFTADRFDANWWADFAIDCGMKYINITTRHHDSFCLWDTKQTDFRSTNTPARRDLVAELTEACDARGLGLCLYYSHGRDWRHPHAPNNGQFSGSARPEYDPPEPTYATGQSHDLNRYVDFMAAQIEELLTGYGPIAAIWLDGIGVPLHPRKASGEVLEDYDPRRDGDPFRCQQLYDLVRRLQPSCLVSYKQGYLHTEDFYAPERDAVPTGGKPGEICETMMPNSWGHDTRYEGQHKSADDVWDRLQAAWAKSCNLLLNCGPLPDGSIHPEDEAPLRAIGQRLHGGSSSD